MGTYRYGIWIAAAPERVYDLYTDLSRIAEWEFGNPRVTDISGDPQRAGATYTVRRGRSASRSEVVVADRPTSHVVRIEGAVGLRAEVTAQFAPEEHGTRFEVVLQPPPPPETTLKKGRALRYPRRDPDASPSADRYVLFSCHRLSMWTRASPDRSRN